MELVDKQMVMKLFRDEWDDYEFSKKLREMPTVKAISIEQIESMKVEIENYLWTIPSDDIGEKQIRTIISIIHKYTKEQADELSKNSPKLANENGEYEAEDCVSMQSIREVLEDGNDKV